MPSQQDNESDCIEVKVYAFLLKNRFNSLNFNQTQFYKTNESSTWTKPGLDLQKGFNF